MFWDVKKTDKLNEMFAGRLEFLQNNYFAYADYALVGTKGYTFEGPFYLDHMVISRTGMRQKQSMQKSL
jgi:predicted phosphohydrolase